MNKKELRILCHFPAGLDAAVNAKFPGANCETKWNLFSGLHTSTWSETLHPAKQRQIKLFIDAYLAGNLELRERLENLIE